MHTDQQLSTQTHSVKKMKIYMTLYVSPICSIGQLSKAFTNLPR